MTTGDEIDRALQRAVHEALVRHKKLGESVAVWHDGRAVVLLQGCAASTPAPLAFEPATPWAAPLADPAALRPLLDLGPEPPSALALWHGQLFVGTAAGQIWKALPATARR